MNHNDEAKKILFNNDNFVYSIKLCHKLFGGYYYEIKYKDRADLPKKITFKSEYNNKGKCLEVLDRFCSLYKKHMFLRIDNTVVNLNNIHDIRYDNVTSTIIYTDGKEIFLRTTNKQFANLYVQAMNNVRTYDK